MLVLQMLVLGRGVESKKWLSVLYTPRGFGGFLDGEARGPTAKGRRLRCLHASRGPGNLDPEV